MIVLPDIHFQLMEVRFMNKKGVTLIELIVVIVIIGIGAVLFAPNIGAWLPNYRLRSAARDIVSTMRSAQMKAVSTNLQYRVNLNPADVGANSYVLQRNTTGGIWVTEPPIQPLPTGVTIVGNTLPNQRAEFNQNSTSSSGSITLQNNRGAQRQLTLTPSTGRVTIIQPGG
jgi:prepilin-type N-terminal cleavage/methylation domain-containing protein